MVCTHAFCQRVIDLNGFFYEVSECHMFLLTLFEPLDEVTIDFSISVAGVAR